MRTKQLLLVAVVVLGLVIGSRPPEVGARTVQDDVTVSVYVRDSQGGGGRAMSR